MEQQVICNTQLSTKLTFWLVMGQLQLFFATVNTVLRTKIQTKNLKSTAYVHGYQTFYYCGNLRYIVVISKCFRLSLSAIRQYSLAEAQGFVEFEKHCPA
jgi:hypothetical protein